MRLLARGACSQSELKAQQGHPSLDSTPIGLSPLPAVCVKEKPLRDGGQDGGRGAIHLLLLHCFGNDKSYKATMEARHCERLTEGALCSGLMVSGLSHSLF